MPRSKIVISALNPSNRIDNMIQLVKPDMMIIQSSSMKSKIESTRYPSIFLPNGVDTEKFQEFDAETKAQLRSKYGLGEDSNFVLHIASIKRERNLDIFHRIQKEGFQVIIVGREGDKSDTKIIKALRDSGCIIWIRNYDNIEEIYNLSNCYVFPTVDERAAIEIPLSILEAMSCNLKIITTPFGGLPLMFTEGDGFQIARNDEEFLEVLKKTSENEDVVNTRNKVIKYSWDHIIEELEGIYLGILGQ